MLLVLDHVTSLYVLSYVCCYQDKSAHYLFSSVLTGLCHVTSVDSDLRHKMIFKCVQFVS